MPSDYCFLTARLGARKSEAADAKYVHTLWTSPAVMGPVGFSRGLPISVGEVRRQIVEGPRDDFGSLLIAEDRLTRTPIGQAKLGIPNDEGICEPDIKLHPSVWGNGYGSELWLALIDYAFAHSDARIVQGTPNCHNTASVRMQMGAGMVKVEEGVFENHVGQIPGAVPVPYLKLQITRAQWQSRRPLNPKEDA